MSERLLKTAISGSFKFKPEIDALHEEFRDHGVEVLEPSKGWLWSPNMQVASMPFRPLPAERGMSIRQIEDRFLQAVAESDFLYVYCPGGYVGLSTMFEIGSALYGEKPVYASDTLDYMELSEGDLEHKTFFENSIAVAGIAQIVEIEKERLSLSSD